MQDRNLPTPPPKIYLDAREQARDLLAQSKPGQFVANMIGKLADQGENVLARLFTIATSEDTDTYPPAVQLKAIQMILQNANAEKIVEVAMGLRRHVGRPGDDAERAAEKQAGEWAEIAEVDTVEDPKGSGHYKVPEED